MVEFDALVQVQSKLMLTSTLALAMIVGHLVGKDKEVWRLYSSVMPILQKDVINDSDRTQAMALIQEFLISLGIKWR